MSRRNNQNGQYNNQYGNNQYYSNGQYYNGNNGNNNQYYNQNQYNRNGQYYNQNQYNQNGQYYNQNQRQNNKFGLYDQPPAQNNKQNKKTNKPLLIKIGAFALFAIILIVVVFAINSCDKETLEPACEEDYRQIGNDFYGYVCIPSDWVKFQEQTANRKLQYSDIETKYILTLDALYTSEIDAKNFALGIAKQLQDAGIEVQGSEAKIGKYDAYEVYGIQTDTQIWVLVYCFETEDGITHYVGVEGPDKTNEAFKIPESFQVKKEN